MQNISIFWPMLAQLLIPILVVLLNAKRKSIDIKSGEFDREAAAMDNEAWSKPVVLTSKNLANQFQFPTIFYVLCIMLTVLDAVTPLVLSLAWAYVAARLVHVVVHTTSNNIAIRMPAFILSMIILMAMFVMTAIAVFAHS